MASRSSRDRKRRERLTGWPYSHALPALNWGTARSVTSTGRIHVVCRQNQDHQYWLAPSELTWSVCSHCAGHITSFSQENA
jgi:hypothetical protein